MTIEAEIQQHLITRTVQYNLFKAMKTQVAIKKQFTAPVTTPPSVVLTDAK